MNALFPIYIVSKGRADTRLTVKTLDKINTPFYIVVESQEYEAYAAVIDSKRILVLDPQYQRNYDTQMPKDELSKGSGPARNFAWDHAVSIGSEWHWCMDDNIRDFYRLHQNEKIRLGDATGLRCMEDFCLRYRNVAMAGPNYYMFAAQKLKYPPFVPNTRIFSCNLIRNDVPFRWRCRYNEDLDLSLRMLKGSWCTILFNAFLQQKITTQTMKGGNQEIYAQGTLLKSQLIVKLHPDVARLAWRYDRAHHHVDYRGFRSLRLLPKKNLELPTEPDNYGLTLQRR